MPPQPYPHRVSFLAPAMVVSDGARRLAPLHATILAAATFDHLVRHPIVTVADFDDDRLTDLDDRLLDARHPEIETNLDWRFRIDRRDEVLWLELSLDPARPTPVTLRVRRPIGPIEAFTADGPDLAAQIAGALDGWLGARRLPPAGAMAPFTIDDLIAAANRLDEARAAATAARGDGPAVPAELLTPPPRLGVPYLRALGRLSPRDRAAVDDAILRLEPGHPVARRNVLLRELGRRRTADRRPILDVIADAPMYGKPHLSVWGDQFAGDRGVDVGVRHQGIAASLLPGNPWACHNYSLELAGGARREESYRWADRATIASPTFDNAHLDCVRRLREVGRPGQAFAEARFRCKDVLDRWRADRVSRFEWPAKYHAGMLLAQVHADAGRLDDAIRVAERVLADLDDPARGPESFAWAVAEVARWRTDPAALARAHARDGSFRGDPGRVLAGFARARVADADDAAMLLDALIALGREDLARVGFHHLLGAGLVGDGKARLIGARLAILGGDLDLALEQLLIVELRRGQSRLEAEINRTLRLACVRDPDEWSTALARMLPRGARRLARMAARDLADFVPGLDPGVVDRALGARAAGDVDPTALAALREALPALGDGAAAIDARLAQPAEATLAAADRLAQEWWSVLVAPNVDRDAHAAGAAYACGVALARYLALAAGPPTPLAGAYRHVATEALHLVRRARYDLDEGAARGLLAVLERAGAPADEWLVDTWLLRVERALNLDGEHGGYLPALLDGLPRVSALLRGDERAGWELRMAEDLGADPALVEPAGALFERCQRALEGGTVAAAWSRAAAVLPPDEAIDVHWVAALANPDGPVAPWLHLGQAQLALGRGDDALASLSRAAAIAGPADEERDRRARRRLGRRRPRRPVRRRRGPARRPRGPRRRQSGPRGAMPPVVRGARAGRPRARPGPGHGPRAARRGPRRRRGRRPVQSRPGPPRRRRAVRGRGLRRRGPGPALRGAALHHRGRVAIAGGGRDPRRRRRRRGRGLPPRGRGDRGRARPRGAAGVGRVPEPHRPVDRGRRGRPPPQSTPPPGTRARGPPACTSSPARGAAWASSTRRWRPPTRQSAWRRGRSPSWRRP